MGGITTKTQNKMITVIVVAAGEGKRFGSEKQFTFLKGKPVLEWSLEAFETHPDVTEIILVLKDENSGKKYSDLFPKIKTIAPGGPKRQDSVFSGFSKIEPETTDIVLIHDGVRPLISRALIDRLISGAEEYGAVIPAIPAEDTLKLIERKKVLQTLDRDKVFRIQTPQAFKYDILKSAILKAKKEEISGTDEAFLVERSGNEVFIIPGDQKNIKITTLTDLSIAEALLEI